MCAVVLDDACGKPDAFERAGDDADGDVGAHVLRELFSEEEAGDSVRDEVSEGEDEGEADDDDGKGCDNADDDGCEAELLERYKNGANVDGIFGKPCERVADGLESCCFEDAVDFCFVKDALDCFAAEFGEKEAGE